MAIIAFLATFAVSAATLPQIYLNIDGGATPSEKKEDHDGTIKIVSADGVKTVYDGAFKIHVRGNSTRHHPKKPYKIKLDKKTDLFGMGKSKHWVLLANYHDESMMRDKLAYDFARKLGIIGMQSTWVECHMNGKPLGCYLLCEHLRIASNRVDIYDWEDAAESVAEKFIAANSLDTALEDELGEKLKKNLSWVTSGEVSYKKHKSKVADIWKKYSTDITGGYIFEFTEPKQTDEHTSFYIKAGPLKFKNTMNSPEWLKSNKSMLSYCKNVLGDFFAATVSDDGYCGASHYSQLADIRSMAGYFMINEFFDNKDSNYASRYAHKDQSKKIVFGPAWDFDQAAGAPSIRGEAGETDGVKNWYKVPYTNWTISMDEKSSFCKEWADDPYFCLNIYSLYWQMRDEFVDISRNGGLIDQYSEYLAEAGARNEKMWFYKVGFSGASGDVACLKEFLAGRVKWLDARFASLDSLISSLRLESTAWPYRDAGEKFAVHISGALKAGEVCARDFALAADETVDMSLGAAAGGIARIDAYTNGVKFAAAKTVDGKAAFTLGGVSPADGCEGREMVQFIARDSRGKAVARTFITLFIADDADDIARLADNGVDRLLSAFPDSEEAHVAAASAKAAIAAILQDTSLDLRTALRLAGEQITSLEAVLAAIAKEENPFKPAFGDIGSVDGSTSQKYEGWALDDGRNVVAAVALSVGKRGKKGVASIKATIKSAATGEKEDFTNKSAAISATTSTKVSLAGRNSEMQLEIGETCAMGTYGNWTLLLGRVGAKAEKAACAAWKGTYEKRSKAQDGDGEDVLTMKIAKSGNVRAAIKFADGKKVVSTSRLILSCDGKDAFVVVTGNKRYPFVVVENLANAE